MSTVVKLGAEDDAPLEAEPPLDVLPEAPVDELPEALGVELDELGVELDELGVELDELGVELEELPPLDAPDEPEAPVELLPLALGDDDDLSLLEDELCAMETLASANSAAAVAVVISFNFIWTFLLQEKWGRDCGANSCNTCAYGVPRRGSLGITPLSPSGLALAGSMTLGRPAAADGAAEGLPCFCASPIAASLAAEATCWTLPICSLPTSFAFSVRRSLASPISWSSSRVRGSPAAMMAPMARPIAPSTRGCSRTIES